MADSNHQRLKELFDRAIELAVGQRAAFLAENCGADVALKRRLEAMLAAADDDQFLSAPTGIAAVPATIAIPGEQAGDQFGLYRLLQQIGEGGFGTVWMAEQKEPVKRRVALKILKLGMDTKQVVARFEQERQALALMDHPNIAKVLDAGATTTGRPYFVMELVKGVPILEYCDSQRLDTRARLALFVDVCLAIQHAHQKGIIHRDIKPSNVLVTLHDGKPVPKVIDFGIAKATNSELTTRTLFTEHRQIVGTPAYMSPEQAEMSGLDIDTRSDVYSLGVLLYELLTGTTPFDIRELLEQGYNEMMRTIREVEPHKPSTRISTLGDTAARTAEHRNLDVKRLGTILRGDLDWIVMRCLEKDRTRRYESASGLALDIERHLQGEIVLAAPPSASYRLQKTVRRHRGLFAAGAVVALALVLGLAGTLWQASVASKQRDVARSEAARADERAEQLEHVSKFQARMLEQIDVTDAGSKLMHEIRDAHSKAMAENHVPDSERAAKAEEFARELARVNATDMAIGIIEGTILAPAVDAVSKQFPDQPLVDAALRQTLATLFQKLGRFDEAQPLQEFALETRRRILGEENVDTLLSLNDMGGLLENQGKYAEAEPYYRKALDGRRRVRGPEHAETMITLGNLGNDLRLQAKFAEAEPILRESVTSSRRVFGESSRATLIRLNVLGYLFIDQGKPAEAEPLWREAYEKGRSALGVDDSDTLVWTNNLGGLMASMGRPKDAEKYYREALEGVRRVHGAEHPGTLSCLNNLATNLQSQGRLDEAEPMIHELLETSRRVLGAEHPDTLGRTELLGMLLRRRGKFDEAEPLMRTSLEIRRRVQGVDHPETLRSSSMLASLLTQTDKREEAEALFREFLEKSLSVLGADHPDRLVGMNNLGNLLNELGKPDEAEAMLRAAYAARRRVSGDEHPETLVVESCLARVLEDRGQLTDAEAMYRDATAKFRRTLGDAHPNTTSSIGNVGKVLVAQKRFAEAEPFLREALANFEKSLGKAHSNVGYMHRSLGVALLGMQRYAEAEKELIEAEHVLSSAQGVSAARRKSCITNLVELYDAWDKAEPDHGHAAKAAKWRAR